MTKIIMIRHGYSTANKEGLFAGWSDAPLTDTGKEQARLCAEFFRCLSDNTGDAGDGINRYGISRVDAIYSSDLSRAYDTSLAVAEVLGLPSVKCEGLREIFGGKWESVPFAKLSEKYPHDYDVWMNDISRAVCTGGESVKDFAERIRRAVTEIAERHDGGVVVIATHATPIRVICTLAAGFEAREIGNATWVSNASVNIFEYDGSFHAVRTNVTEHLAGFETELPQNI